MRIPLVCVCLLAAGVLVDARQAAQDPAKRWDEIFTRGYKGDLIPNAFLARTIEGRNPGVALDIAMGQGRNAFLLAERGLAVFSSSRGSIGRP